MALLVMSCSLVLRLILVTMFLLHEDLHCWRCSHTHHQAVLGCLLVALLRGWLLPGSTGLRQAAQNM